MNKITFTVRNINTPSPEALDNFNKTVSDLIVEVYKRVKEEKQEKKDNSKSIVEIA
jgi:hypothetical protein